MYYKMKTINNNADLIFNQIVNLFMSKKLENIDMAESLKSVE